MKNMLRKSDLRPIYQDRIWLFRLALVGLWVVTPVLFPMMCLYHGSKLIATHYWDEMKMLFVPVGDSENTI